MSIITTEDIFGAHLTNGTVVCANCMNGDWPNQVNEHDLILRRDVEEDPDTAYFCDECGKHLPGDAPEQPLNHPKSITSPISKSGNTDQHGARMVDNGSNVSGIDLNQTLELFRGKRGAKPDRQNNGIDYDRIKRTEELCVKGAMELAKRINSESR